VALRGQIQKRGLEINTDFTRLNLIMDSSYPPILCLPTDLLSDILLLSLRSPTPKHLWALYPTAFEPTKSTAEYAQLLYDMVNAHGGKATESNFHTIRSTCRLFRRIADNFSFWKSDTFGFTNLLDALFVNTEFLEVFLFGLSFEAMSESKDRLGY
jgi:hypothetical protein